MLEAVHDWANNRKSETAANMTSCFISVAKAGFREVKPLKDIQSNTLLSNYCSPISGIGGIDGNPMSDPVGFDKLSDSDMQKLYNAACSNYS